MGFVLEVLSGKQLEFWTEERTKRLFETDHVHIGTDLIAVPSKVNEPSKII